MNAVVTGAIALIAIFGGISALRVLLALRVSRGDRGIGRSEESSRTRRTRSAFVAPTALRPPVTPVPGTDLEGTPLPEGTLASASRPDTSNNDGRRLSLLRPAATGRTTLDGVWWPRSTSLAAELPALIGEFRRRGLCVTGVAANPDLWDPAPRLIAAESRLIHLGWSRSIGRHLLLLCSTGGYPDGCVELLVIAPDAAPAHAAEAIARAATANNRSSGNNLLAAMRTLRHNPEDSATTTPRRQPAEPDLPAAAAWESEGGDIRPDSPPESASSAGVVPLPPPPPRRIPVEQAQAFLTTSK